MAYISLYNSPDTGQGGVCPTNAASSQLVVSSQELGCFKLPTRISSYTFDTMTFMDNVDVELEIVFSPYSNCAPTSESTSVIDTNSVVSWRCKSLEQAATHYRVSKVSNEKRDVAKPRSAILAPRGVPLTESNANGMIYIFGNTVYRVCGVYWRYRGMSSIFPPVTPLMVTRLAVAVFLRYNPQLLYGQVNDFAADGSLYASTQWHSTDFSFHPIAMAAILLDVAAGIPLEDPPYDVDVFVTNTNLNTPDDSSMQFFWLYGG
ncbi:hypothetical protein N7466_011231 [Penicillium verhagenii]|uniref:uncharacterized protein n=1 Tax=Penicillium verhagenii TaxID=1562060 RepID=UPI002544F865|nr:uncharacterized protein N7466_011231 [Penicillium verhagenii]KAJ5917677.1 hypothetical protein N7466_011231 [Penicillium verhagenii]